MKLKVFESKNGVIQEAVVRPSCLAAKVIDGGFSSDDGGFFVSIEAIGCHRGISGKIKDPEVYDKILQAYLSKEDVMILL